MKQLARDTLTMKPIAAILLLGAFLTHALVSALVPPGLATKVLTGIALGFCILTAIARVNDIEAHSLRWHVRRIGLIAALGGCAQLLWQICTTPFTPSWTIVLLFSGFALTWLTTPNQKPWWRLLGEPDLRKEPRPSEPQL